MSYRFILTIPVFFAGAGLVSVHLKNKDLANPAAVSAPSQNIAQNTVAEDTRTYMDKILNNNAFVEWKQQALAEPWSIADYEAGHTVVEDYRTPTY